MALAGDLLSLLNEDEREYSATYERQPVNTGKLRKKAAEALRKTREQISGHAEGTGVKGRRSWNEKNGIYSITLPVPVEGKSEIKRPKAKALRVLDLLQAHIEGGALDDALVAASAGGEPAKATGGSGRGPKAGSGWSPARRAAHEARMAGKRKA